MLFFGKSKLLVVLKDFKSRTFSYIDDKISSINKVEDLSSEITKADTIKTVYLTKLQKVKNVVNFRLDVTIQNGTFTVKLGTIPSTLVPTPKVTINTTTNKGLSCYLYIDSDGSFGVTLIDTKKTIADDDGIRISIVYFV